MASDIQANPAKFRPTGFTIGDPGAQIFQTLTRRAVLGIIVSFIFLAYFGIGLKEDFSLSISMIAMYAVLPALFLERNLALDRAKLGAYLVFVYSVLLTKLSATGPNISSASMYYLIVLYFPFVFTVARTAVTDALYERAIRFFLNCMIAISIIAVVQFLSQFVVRLPWVFNISLIIPRAIVDRGGWNTGADVGSFFKANGFFLREPSELSNLLGFAVLIEFLYFRRLLRLAIYGIGILLSFSGTGMFVVAAGLLIPTKPKALLRAAAILAVGFAIIPPLDAFVFDGYFLHRLDEFNREGSSAWARFIAPQSVVEAGMSSVERTWLGNGSGSLAPSLSMYAGIWYEGRWEIHGPTWAKLLYEYGILGAAAGFLFLIVCLWRSRGPAELKIAGFYAWLASGGQLLQPVFLAVIFSLIILWPKNRQLPFRRSAKLGRYRTETKI